MSDEGQPMDRLHRVLTSIRTETKSARDHHSVFREFLTHLDHAQRKSAKRVPAKSQPRRPVRKRTK